MGPNKQNSARGIETTERTAVLYLESQCPNKQNSERGIETVIFDQVRRAAAGRPNKQNSERGIETEMKANRMSTQAVVRTNRIPSGELKLPAWLGCAPCALCPNKQNSERGIETPVRHSQGPPTPSVRTNRIPSGELKLSAVSSVGGWEYEFEQTELRGGN